MKCIAVFQSHRAVGNH